MSRGLTNTKKNMPQFYESTKWSAWLLISPEWCVCRNKLDWLSQRQPGITCLSLCLGILIICLFVALPFLPAVAPSLSHQSSPRSSDHRSSSYVFQLTVNWHRNRVGSTVTQSNLGAHRVLTGAPPPPPPPLHIHQHHHHSPKKPQPLHGVYPLIGPLPETEAKQGSKECMAKGHSDKPASERGACVCVCEGSIRQAETTDR